MKISYEYISKNKFPHRYHVRATPEERLEILEWFSQSGKYKIDYIYWGLKKAIEWSSEYRHLHTSEIFIKEKNLAMAFKLRWM